MKNNYFILAIILLSLAGFGLAQRPPQVPPGMGGPPPAPRDGQMGPGREHGGNPPQDDWFMRLDTNADGKVDATELQAAINASFTAWDKHGNGILEADEI